MTPIPAPKHPSMSFLRVVSSLDESQEGVSFSRLAPRALYSHNKSDLPKRELDSRTGGIFVGNDNDIAELMCPMVFVFLNRLDDRESSAQCVPGESMTKSDQSRRRTKATGRTGGDARATNAPLGKAKSVRKAQASITRTASPHGDGLTSVQLRSYVKASLHRAPPSLVVLGARAKHRASHRKLNRIRSPVLMKA